MHSPPNPKNKNGAQVGFEELEKWALSNPDPAEGLPSGRQELAEIYLSMHIK